MFYRKSVFSPNFQYFWLNRLQTKENTTLHTSIKVEWAIFHFFNFLKIVEYIFQKIEKMWNCRFGLHPYVLDFVFFQLNFELMKYSSIRHIRLRHIRQFAIYDMEPLVTRMFLSLPCIFIRRIRHPVYTTFAIYDIFFDPLGSILLYIPYGIYDI